MTTLLLTSVFGPYGVDDAYGRKENVMELFHNQVTREQGIFSLRFHHHSFGLHLLAENVEAGVKVLDFPSQRRFVREIKKGYDYVGISFIAPNFVKARRMAELVRRHAPQSKIILGGHGTRIPDLERLVEHDHICRGEGVRWLRRLLGEDPERPVKHPVIGSTLQKWIMGIPRPIDAAVLIPGVGCPNGCRFCCTSHFFDKQYTPYLATGDDLFRACQEVEAKTGLTEFFVMDENFLKYRERAERFLQLLEQSGKSYCFGIFSSAETVQAVGVEFLARLGVYFLWLGVESKRDIYEKNKGIDFHSLIDELRDHGIAVLASGILFSEHHDQQTIQEEIDFMVSLDADFVQFMQLGPMPQTALYLSYQEKGLLLDDVPYEEQHGQDRIWFKHPHFTRAESKQILKQAFERDYQVNGPSLLRFFETQARGARRLAGTTGLLAKRREQLLQHCREYRPLLPWIERLAPTLSMKRLARDVIKQYEAALGPSTARDRLFAAGATPFVLKEQARVRLGRATFQPRTLETRYRLPRRRLPELDVSAATAPARLSAALD
ncbi:MAG: cobalamin-dependent protein [Deltaproteobacteria bacterium]|nr:cobalamin-dependent protein [Deltaproteobacteria bacterium]